MRKLCLILTVLYAFGANCSAQSLNIVENLLLKDNSSTFESGMGGWTYNVTNGACSIDNTNGNHGYYLKLTDTEVGNDWDEQMEYKIKDKGYPPAYGKKYVIKFWAKRNGNSGTGQIKVLLQKNNASEKWPQQVFNGNPFTVSNDWKHYEFDISANKGDYEVIKINFGKCGEVWIDDIEYGEYTDYVAPVPATGVTLNRRSASVKQGRSITLTATFKPAGAASQNVTWSSSDKSVATVDNNGVVTGVAPGNAKITVTTEDGNHTASCTVTVTTYLPPVMLYDFNDNDATDVIKIAYPSHPYTGEAARKDHLYIDIKKDPYSDGQCLWVSDGDHKPDETLIIDLGPSGVDFGGYGILAFDINFQKGVEGEREDANYKDVKINLECQKKNGTTEDVELQMFRTPVFPAPVWDTKLIPLTRKTESGETVSVIPEGATPVKLKIGPLNSWRCLYLIDNIRIKEKVEDVEDYTQDDDLSDIWWKYANETLYIKGTGPIPEYTGSKKCPWEDRTQYIKHVVVSEGITGIGNYSVGNSKLDNVDITLHSIPEYFGQYCLQREINGKLTRTLHLELRDEEKPFIAKSKSTYFPTFNTAKYFRDVKSNYSTVCLPFPISQSEVSNKGATLYDFKSMGMTTVGGEDQYTLEFKGHTGGMEAGQPYLIGSGNIVLSNDEGTTVKPEDFNLTPTKVTRSVGNPDVSITMEGVFQPVVIAEGNAYGFLGGKFYMNGGNMSVRPMRASFNGSQLYSAPVQGEQAKKMPKMFNFEIVPDNVTHISSPAFIAEDFNIEEVYSPSGMKTESLNKGLNIIRTSTGRVLKVMVK